jgi:branched-chain amino acid transport system permease protein
VVFIFFVVALSGFTKAWLLYLGLFFVGIVLYAPGGIASLILMQFPVIRAGRWRDLALPYALAALAALVPLAGVIGLVEMVYRLSEPGASTMLSVLWITFDARDGAPWFVFAAVLVGGLAALRRAARFVGERWDAIQQDLQPRTA